MIDLKLLLNEFEAVSKKLSTKKVEESTLLNLKNLAWNYKKAKQKLEELQAKQNQKSKEFGASNPENRNEKDFKTQMYNLKQEIQNLQEEVSSHEQKLNEELFSIPNIPDFLTPAGESESDNIEIKKILKPRDFDFEPKEHWELAQINDWIDFQRGVKLAKSRFSVIKGEAAKLNRALINFMLDHNQKAGFEPVITPVIVNEKMLFSTGQLPKFKSDMFQIQFHPDLLSQEDEEKKNQDFYLISTSEITLTNLFNDEILKEEQLPILLTSQTPCFRKEAGSAGKDTRGIIRQHQFDKVELVALTKPDQSYEIQQKMIQTASEILTKLNLPHRLVQLCGADLGFSASNTVDIEVWLPGQKCYREISSISNCTDFQARRAKIRYKQNNKNFLVHTLNGSSLAVGRTLVAIMENYQNQDGSISIPDVLKPYLA